MKDYKVHCKQCGARLKAGHQCRKKDVRRQRLMRSILLGAEMKLRLIKAPRPE